MIGKHLAIWLAAAGLGLCAGAATGADPTHAPAAAPPIIQIGSAYVAKQMCSCLFVAGRSEPSCRAEFKGQIEPFKVIIDRADLPRTAKVGASLGAVVAEADYDRRFGCVIVK